MPASRDAYNPNWYGLLTYTMYRTLAQAAGRLTHAELLQRVRTEYAGRPQGAPTPGLEGGGAEREVLGVAEWPRRSAVVLRRRGDGYAVAAGDLHGLTVGSVLAVSGPAGTADAGRPLGHVRLTRVDAAESRAEPVAHAGRPAPATLPDLAPCRVVFLDFGASRFRVWVDIPDGPARQAVLAAVGPLADPDERMVELADRAAADWVIRLSGWHATLAEASGPRPPVPLGSPGQFGFRGRVRTAFEKAHHARALLGLSARGEEAAHAPGVTSPVAVEVLRHADENAPGVPVTDAVPLRVGELFSCRVRNQTADRELDVTVLLVGTDFEVVAAYPGPNQTVQPVGPGETLVSQKFFVSPPIGADRLVAIAVPARRDPADFAALTQRGIRSKQSPGQRRALATPLGQVFRTALLRTAGGPRGAELSDLGEIAVRLVPLRTVPR